MRSQRLDRSLLTGASCRQGSAVSLTPIPRRSPGLCRCCFLRLPWRRVAALLHATLATQLKPFATVVETTAAHSLLQERGRAGAVPRTDEGCPCSSPDATISCWTGPAEDRGVGTCKDGTRTCQGGEFTGWGPCTGEVLTCGAFAPDAQPPLTNATSDSCRRLAISAPPGAPEVVVCRLTPIRSGKSAPMDSSGVRRALPICPALSASPEVRTSSAP